MLLAHAVLGVTGGVHHLKPLFAFAQRKGSARVIAAADGFGNTGHFLQKFHMGQIVQIDIGMHLIGLLHILNRRIVAAEHNIAARKAAGLAEHQLGVAAAVHTAAFLLQNLQQIGVGGGLYSEVLFVAFVPAESLVQCACTLTNAFFVVYMKRRGHIANDGLGLCLG